MTCPRFLDSLLPTGQAEQTNFYRRLSRGGALTLEAVGIASLIASVVGGVFAAIRGQAGRVIGLCLSGVLSIDLFIIGRNIYPSTATRDSFLRMVRSQDPRPLLRDTLVTRHVVSVFI